MKKIWGILVLVLAFGIPAFSQARMSPEDQSRFNSYYSRWIQAQQTNDRDDVVGMERRMQDLMNRYGIPSDTPYDVVARQNWGYRGRERDRYYHRDRDRDWDRGDDRGYVGSWERRLSPDDQRRFDEAYRHWLHERQENDRNGMARQESTMQNIMSRYNIPQDVPYDAIAGGGRY
jgi:hypothetical protein